MPMAEPSAFRTIKPTDLPAPPQTAIEIMRACSRDNVSQRVLASLAANDPVLSAELLRIVNSPFYGLAREVRSIAQAVILLGHRALRNLALCIAVRDALKHEQIPGFDVTAYWEDSLRRAVGARLLGSATRQDADECFTAGLLQDFGLLVMMFVHKDKGGLWPSFRKADPDSRRDLEQETFQITHDAVVEMLATVWDLPETLGEALSSHHAAPPNASSTVAQSTMARTLYCADWMAAVYAAQEKASVVDRCRELLAEQFSLSAETIEECLTCMPEQVEEAAAALGLRIERQEDFEHVLQAANVRLAEENLSYQELTLRLQKALRERDALAEQLNRELELAREIQRSLLPSGATPGFPVTGINVPARELSGDFFDYFSLDDGRIYFNLADVSGKGVNAALLMAKASSLFRCLGKRVRAPGQLLAQINVEICETSIRGMFVTMIAGLYDPASGHLRLVNAGHPPGILLRKDGALSALEAQAPPLGVDPGCTFPEVDVPLDGGSLYLFSDGVTEGHTAEGEELGMRGLLGMIAEEGDRLPGARLESIVTRFTSSTLPLRDDITMLLLEEHGAPEAGH
jgi:sigma-B regulation protein RsbU (phosphoserine phosphatase)